jgi:Bacterial PH domain
MASGPAPEPTSAITRPVVIRISPMAHFATGFLALGMLVLIPVFPTWGATALVIPFLASVAIVRLRTVADLDTVTARTLLGSRTVAWHRIEGLRFTKSKWARAHLDDGEELLLPAVTFSTLPLLTAASGGRVPNPYAPNP